MKPMYAVLPPDQFFVASGDMRPPPDGASIDDLLPADLSGRARYVCLLVSSEADGIYVPRSQWDSELAPGQCIVFHRPILGGGNGSNTVLRLVVAIAAAYAGQYNVAFGLAVGIAGSIAANLIAMPSAPPQPSASPTYNFNAQANTARIDQPIPELFGHMPVYPDFAAPPYYDYDDNNSDQFYSAVLLVSEGEIEILKAYIDDTPLNYFAAVSLARCGPGQSTRDGPGDGYETLAEQELVDVSMVTALEVSGMDLPSGRFAGPFTPLKAEYRATAVHIDILLPRGLDDGRSISWRIEVRPVDDFGAPTGSWSTLGTETISTSSVTPIRRSYTYELESTYRPQVRAVRTDDRTGDDGAAHDLAWAALRCTLDTAGIAHDTATYLVLRIRASQQLSQITQARFRVLARRLLPVYDSDGWSDPQATRNPAWALAYVMQGRGLTDEQIDIEQLQTLAAIWDARQDRFDMVVDEPSTVWEAMTTMARVGRAVPVLRGSMLTVWRDQQEETAVAAFTMRDIRAGSFELSFSLPDGDPIDAIDLEYFDRRRWDWVTVTAQYADGQIYGYRGIAERADLGLAAPAGPARVRVPGITGEQQAIRTAVFHLADLIYRPTRASLSTELQGLLPAYGSLVSLQHDVGDFGQGGEAVGWTAGTLTLETSEPLVWSDESDASHYVRLVRADGTLTARIAVTEGGSEFEMVLDEAPDFEPEVSGADRERTRYVFGPAENMEGLAKVRAITPRSQREIGVELVLEDDRVHTADEAWLPTSDDDEQDPVDTTPPTDDADPNVLARVRDKDIVGLASVGTTYYSLLNTGLIAGYAFGTITDEWIMSGEVPLTEAAKFEVRFTYLGGGHTYNVPGEGGDPPPTTTAAATPPTSGAALDTWLSLGTDRNLYLNHAAAGGGEASPPISYDCDILVEVRIAATGVVQTSATVTLCTVGSVPPTPP